MEKKEFVNTGAYYCEEGQEIVVILGEEKSHFIDFSRGIDGTVPAPNLTMLQVLGHYAKGNYDSADIEVRMKEIELYKEGKEKGFKDISGAYQNYLSRW